MGVTEKPFSTGTVDNAASSAGALTAPSITVKTPPAGDDLSGGIDFAHLPRQQTGALSGNRTPTFQVIFRRSALARIHKHGEIDPKVEICGVLVGEVYQDATGPYLLIDSAIEGISSKGSIGQVTFTPETWQHIQTVMDAEHPDRRIVGWYHTHPGHGIFLSEMDMFIHQSFFNLPWQTAFVYDPQRHEEGIFGWADGAIQKLDYLIEADQAASRPASPGPDAGKSGAGKTDAGKSDAGAVSGNSEFGKSEYGQPTSGQTSSGQTSDSVRRITNWEPPEETVVRPPKRRSVARQAFLSVIGLLLFAATGYLLGTIILDLHIALPTPLHNLLQELKHSL